MSDKEDLKKMRQEIELKIRQRYLELFDLSHEITNYGVLNKLYKRLDVIDKKLGR